MAAVARDRGLDLVRMVGHGSSDNAASYGVYAFGLLPALDGAAGLDLALGLLRRRARPPRLAASLALSQSGQTPDVLEYVERARARGALTIAITNEPDSALATAAELVLPLAAGEERSIAATKTYTTQIAALALLAAHAAGRGDEIGTASAHVAACSTSRCRRWSGGSPRSRVALAFVGRHVRDRPGHGVRNSPRDLAEAARDVPRRGRAADRDRSHPRAARRARRAVPGLDDRLGRREPARRARSGRAGARRGGDAVASGTGGRTRSPTPATTLPVADAAVPLLSPLLSVVPGQLLAWALAQAKGLDPDRPSGLSKITLAL